MLGYNRTQGKVYRRIVKMKQNYTKEQILEDITNVEAILDKLNHSIMNQSDRTLYDLGRYDGRNEAWLLLQDISDKLFDDLYK